MPAFPNQHGPFIVPRRTVDVEIAENNLGVVMGGRRRKNESPIYVFFF